MKTSSHLTLLLKRFALFALLASGLAAMAGCETTAGFGRDVEKLGENIEEEAEEKQKY